MSNAWIFYLIGMLLGILINEFLHYRKSSYGTLKIDRSGTEKDIYQIIISEDLEKLPNKKYIMLKVDNTANLSDLRENN